MGQVAKALGFGRQGGAEQRGHLAHARANDNEGEGNGVNGVATARAGGRRHRHAPGLPLAALALVLAAMHPCPSALSQAQAQSSAQPTITMAPTIAAEPASQAAFPIRVGPANAVPRNSFVRLRGLPPMAALSEGHSIGPGAWAVALAALPDLKIMLPAGSTGRSEIVVTLVAVDGKVLAEAKSTLAVPAGQKTERSQAQREPGPPAVASILRAGVAQGAERSGQPSQPATQAVTPQDRERALRLLKKGDERAKATILQAGGSLGVLLLVGAVPAMPMRGCGGSGRTETRAPRPSPIRRLQRRCAEFLNLAAKVPTHCEGTASGTRSGHAQRRLPVHPAAAPVDQPRGRNGRSCTHQA